MKRVIFVTLSLLVVLAPVRAQTADEKKATIAYVQKLQTNEGGFRSAANADKPSLSATTAAIRVLKYFGGELQNKDGCAKFVRELFDKETGGFRDMPAVMPTVNSTAVGLMAVAELKMPADDFKDAVTYLEKNAKNFEEIRIAAAGLEAVGKRPATADAWLGELKKLRNPDGLYGKGDAIPRDTGGSVVTVLRLGGKVDNADAVLKALKAGQRTDGGFGKAGANSSDLETTYRVMRAFAMLKAKPDVEKLLGFVAKCRNADGGYGIEPGKPSAVGPTYFAAIITHWSKE